MRCLMGFCWLLLGRGRRGGVEDLFGLIRGVVRCIIVRFKVLIAILLQ